MTTTGTGKIASDVAGATIIEFAIVAPVMLMLIMGLGEVSYQAYIQSILTGAVQKAGRDAGIQGNDTQSTQIDAKVVAQLGQLASGWAANCSSSPPAGSRTYCSTRKSYAQYGYIAPEPYTDSNGNGQYDSATECFTDLNGNGVWDADPGLSGQGGASDVNVYTMAITYPRLFPIGSALGLTGAVTLKATTILKNQPYATQNGANPVQICPH